MEIYCAVESQHSGSGENSGTGYFYGRTRAIRVKRARAKGWMLKYTNRRWYCPKCSGKKTVANG